MIEESSFAGHLAEVQNQTVPENLCALPLARDSETQRKPQGWVFLERTYGVVKRTRDRKRMIEMVRGYLFLLLLKITTYTLRISYVADTALRPLETFTMVESAYCHPSLQTRKQRQQEVKSRQTETLKD